MNDLVSERKISVFSPATVANVVCGFDVFGFSLDNLGDTLTLTVTDAPGVTISRITGDQGKLPRDPEQNTAGVSVAAMMNALCANFGVEIEIEKKMPISSGLGSSAASSVASVFALNCLLKKPFTREELLKFAIEGEKIASGYNTHIDNLGACLFGGFILARSKNPIDVVSLPVPQNLSCIIIHPHIEIRTADARAIVRKRIPLHKAVTQWGNIAGVIAALYRSDLELLKRSLDDVIVEPVRAKLIPHFYELKEAALKNRALGSSIAGSGPSVFALVDDEIGLHSVATAMQKVLDIRKIAYDLYISKISKHGPKVIS